MDQKEVVKPKKEKVLFLHGFGGSSITYHPFLAKLSDNYETYSFDWLGMGCSGHPDIPYIKLSPRQTIDLFVSVLRKWIEAEQLADFHLVAHSMGAYFAGFYLQKYPQGVKSFSCLSAAGVTDEPHDFKEKLKGESLPLKRKAMKYFWQFMDKGYIRGWHAFSLMPMGWVVNKWTEGRLNFTGQLKKEIVAFVSTMLWDKRYSGDLILSILKYRAFAKIPMALVLEEVESKVPTIHVWGDKDWMDKHEFVKFHSERKSLLQKII